MSIIDPSTPLATIVNERPELAATFEDLGVDYCCGGERRLDEACDAAGLRVDDVIGRLTTEPPAAGRTDWPELAPPELVDHLEATHHAYLGDALPRIDVLLEKVIAAHGARHPELNEVAVTFRELRADLEPHLMKEERILFPMIRELYSTTGVPHFHCGSLRNPIGVMCAEHDRAGELLARLRSATSVYTVPADGCARYEALYAGLAQLEADTHLHIHKENNLLFTTVVAEELRRTSDQPSPM